MGRERTGPRAAGDAPHQAQPPAQPAADKANNKPVHEVRLGPIKAAVWANTGESGVWFSVVISRLYKEGDSWKRSESFSRDDLPLVAKVADLAHTWIYEQQAADHP